MVALLLLMAGGSLAVIFPKLEENRQPLPEITGYIEAYPTEIVAPSGGYLRRLHVRKGDLVDPGQTLFELDAAREQAEVAEFSARRQASEAELDLARRQHERMKQLRDEELISDERYDAAARDLATQTHGLQAMEQHLEQVEWELAQRTQAAPSAGRVIAVYYQLGEWVPQGRPLLSLSVPEEMRVRFYLPLRELERWQIGDRVRVTPVGSARTMEATLVFIASEPEYTPPFLYHRKSRSELVFLAELQPEASALAALKPGQPVGVQRGQPPQRLADASGRP